MIPGLALLLACSGLDPDLPTDSDGETDPASDSLPTSDDTDTDDAATDAPADPGYRLEATPFVPCAAPERRAERAYDLLTQDDDFAAQTWDPTNGQLYQGGGITVADLTGDGRPDLLLPDEDRWQYFVQTPSGTFMDATDWLPAIDNSQAVTATAADYDGDGDLDLAIARIKAQNLLLVNDGEGRFADATVLAGLNNDVDNWYATASFADFDLDGDLDLFFGGHGNFYGNPRPPGDPSQLYRNRGDGRFEDVSHLLPAEFQEGFTFVGAWVDLNGDRYPELYGVNDFGDDYPSRLLWNDGGLSFRIDDTDAGLDVRVQGMGLGLGDLNRDGVVDLLVSGWGNNALLLSAGGGAWFESHRLLGIDADSARSQAVAWGVEMADLDHDTDLDVVQGFGMIYNQRNPEFQPDEIFERADDGTFAHVGVAWGFSHVGQTRGVAVVDVDGDGWLDIARRDLVGPAEVYKARCGSGASITLSLDQPGLNRRGIGAVVRARVKDQIQTRWLGAGTTSVMTSIEPVLHFGLGDATAVDELEINWPDGGLTRIADVPTGQALHVRRTTSD
jgi:hypothetical protein